MEIQVISALRGELKQGIDDKTKSSYSRFFKEKISFYGVKSAIVRKIAKKYFPEVEPLGKKGIFALCEELLRSDYEEEAFIAFDWAYRLKDKYAAVDFATFEKWLSYYVNNWAKCDTLCNHTLGAFVEKYPEFIEYLKQWTKLDNRWLRRASAVTLIIPAKKGKFLKDIFEIADSLLRDEDDMVQKGYGWLLKDASIQHQAEVLAYVMKNKPVMPRTALRYAIERMPESLRQQAMERSRAKP